MIRSLLLRNQCLRTTALSTHSNSKQTTGINSRTVAESILSQISVQEATFLIRSLRTIYANPTSRTLVLARIKMKLGDDVRWVVKWLWSFAKDEHPSLPSPQSSEQIEKVKQKFISSVQSAERSQTVRLLDKQVKTGGKSIKKTPVEELAAMALRCAPLALVSEISEVVECYAKELMTADQLCTNLKKICTLHGGPVLPLLQHLSVDIKPKLRYDLTRRQAVQDELLEDFSVEIQRYVECSPAWFEEDQARKSEKKSMSEKKNRSTRYTYWKPTHCHRTVMRCRSSPSSSSTGYQATSLSSSTGFEPQPSVTASSEYTLFLSGLDPSVVENDLIDALSRCGEVSECQIRRIGIAEGVEHIQQQQQQQQQPRTVSSSPKSSPSTGKKPPIPPSVSDTHAFVTMATEDGYLTALQDDTRIFGISINRTLTSVQSASQLRTLYVYVRQSLNGPGILEFLLAALGPDYSIDIVETDDPNQKPVFVHLEFPSHDEAKLAFDRLSERADTVYFENTNDKSKSFPLAPSWIKSNWYYKVADKAKEMELNASCMEAAFLSEEEPDQSSDGMSMPSEDDSGNDDSDKDKEWMEMASGEDGHGHGHGHGHEESEGMGDHRMEDVYER
eukprot:gene1490-2871_t